MPDFALINGVKYPVAVDESGIMWRIVSVEEERDEVWEDWSGGMGATETAPGRYLFSDGGVDGGGFDATKFGVLNLCPLFLADNNTNLTTGYGYFAEEEGAGTTLTFDAVASTTETDFDVGETISFSHTVGTNDDRLLLVFVHLNSISAHNIGAVRYGGRDCFYLSGKSNATSGITLEVWAQVAPASGANTVEVEAGAKLDDNSAAEIAAISFYNVDQDDPFGTVVPKEGSGTSPTITVSSASGQIVVTGFVVNNDVLFTAGTGETERWDDKVGTAITGAGFTEAGAASVTVNPSHDGAVDDDYIAIGVPVRAAAAQFVFIEDGPKIFKYSFDTTQGPSLVATSTPGGDGGQMAKFAGKWYAAQGSGTNAVRLDDPDTPTWADSGFEALHLAAVQEGPTPYLYRVETTNTNVIGKAASAPTADGDFSNAGTVGDSSTAITHLVQAQGLIYASKEDNLYEFGLAGESRPIIPFLNRGAADADNGKYSDAFGDEVSYPSTQGLWRYTIGGDAAPFGVESIRDFRRVPGIVSPKGGRPAGQVTAGQYRYQLHNVGETSFLLQRQGDALHTVLSLPLCKGMYVDSRNRLWLKGASANEDTRDVRVIELNSDGGLDVQGRKGRASTSNLIFLDERNGGRPFDLKHLAAAHIEVEGVDSTSPVSVYVLRDGSTTLEQVGANVTADGVSLLTWTVGTSDTAYRFRTVLYIATTSSYDPVTSNPVIHRLKVVYRYPEIISITIPASKEALAPYDLTPDTAEQNLKRLRNQGVVAMQRPGDTSTFNGEVIAVTDTLYKTGEQYGQRGHGIELTVRKLITS